MSHRSFLHLFKLAKRMDFVLSSLKEMLNLLFTNQSQMFEKLISYDDKKVRDVGLTCSCYLTNIMSDSIFDENMRQGITCYVLFCLFVCFFVFVCCLLFLRGDNSVFFRIKEMDSVLSL